MKTYLLKLKHDTGTTSLFITARDKDAARKLATQSEGCPECAIISVRELIRKPVWIVPKG